MSVCRVFLFWFSSFQQHICTFCYPFCCLLSASLSTSCTTESKRNYIINQAAFCEWAVGAGSPGRASVIYFNLVPWLNTSPRGPKKTDRSTGNFLLISQSGPGYKSPLESLSTIFLNGFHSVITLMLLNPKIVCCNAIKISSTKMSALVREDGQRGCLTTEGDKPETDKKKKEI